MALRKQINDAMPIQIDQDRAITLTTTKRPIVHAKNAHLTASTGGGARISRSIVSGLV